jgi:hypothetical protein
MQYKQHIYVVLKVYKMKVAALPWCDRQQCTRLLVATLLK